MKNISKREPSRPLSELPLVQQIDIIIARNGAVTQEVKDLLMFSVVKTLIVAVDEIQATLASMAESTKIAEENLSQLNENVDKRITILEKRNIVTWAIAHPKTTLVILGLVALLLLTHYGAFIFEYIGIDLPLN